VTVAAVRPYEAVEAGLPLDETDLVLLRAAASAATVAQTARAVGLTPRAAARRLDRLARRLGLELLHRDGGRVAVSPAGHRVLAAGTSLLAAIAAAPATLDAGGGRLTLDDVHLLHAVAATGSLNRAARVLLMSQPALSRRVRRLEDTLGAALLVRSNHGTVLSPLAGALLGQISDAMAAFRAALVPAAGRPA
jgi:DNA-binding transcriptional LysR family regulator